MNLTAALLGNASRTRDLLPNDGQVDILALSIHAYKVRSRCAAVIEMHDDVLTGDRWAAYPDIEPYRAWLRETGTPVFMHHLHPEIPASYKYPRLEIESRFGSFIWRDGKNVLTLFGGSASYGVALAMYLGYKRLEIYGIELAKEQYREDRDSFFRWIGRAEGIGMQIVVPAQSRLFHDTLYPYEVIL